MENYLQVLQIKLSVGLIIGISSAFVIILMAVILFIVSKRKKKTNNFDYNEFIEALGSLKNISSVSNQGSRLSIEVLDKKEIDREKLQQLGASALIVTSKKITLIMGVIAKDISAYISNKLS